MMIGLVLIVFGLASCLRFREWGEASARRVIAYDAIWLYQLMYLLLGLFFFAFGVAVLFGWVQWHAP